MDKKLIELGPGQMKVFQSNARFIALVCGIQSGKTFVGSAWMIDQIDQFPNDQHLILASTYKVLSQATLLKFEDELPHGWVKKYKSPEDFYYQILPNKRLGRTGKGRIWIRSAENPNKIEGMTLRSAWFDEAGDAPELAWTNLQGRLSILQGKCLMTSTPYAWNWLKDFIDQWEKDTAHGTRPGELSFDYINYPSWHNPTFPKKEYFRMKKVLPAHEFNRRYNGLFTRPEGLIYTNFNPEIHVLTTGQIEKMLSEDPVQEVIGGVDWGDVDPSVCSAILLTRDGKYLIVQEWYQAKADDKIARVEAKKIQDTWRHLNWVRYYADNNRPEYIRSFNTHGIPTAAAKKGADSIRAGIDRIRELLSLGRLYVSEECPRHIEEFQAYRYKVRVVNGVKVTTGEPNDKSDNHCMDQLRYAVFSHRATTYEAAEPVKEFNPIRTIMERIEEQAEYAGSIMSSEGGFDDDFLTY